MRSVVPTRHPRSPRRVDPDQSAPWVSSTAGLCRSPWLRFGSELVFSLCEHFGVEVIIINASEDSTFEEDLANDVIEIATVFSARLYGSRSDENKQVMERLQEVAKELSP